MFGFDFLSFCTFSSQNLRLFEYMQVWWTFAIKMFDLCLEYASAQSYIFGFSFSCRFCSGSHENLHKILNYWTTKAQIQGGTAFCFLVLSLIDISTSSKLKLQKTLVLWCFQGISLNAFRSTLTKWYIHPPPASTWTLGGYHTLSYMQYLYICK